jgi:flagellar motility protein MotE (MotC chaperone)
MKMLSSPLVASILGLILYVVTTAMVWKPAPRAPHKPVEGEAGDSMATIMARANGAVPSWDYHNPDVDSVIEELKSRKEQLDRREKDLNALAERLQAERLEINVVTQSVFRMQKEFDAGIARVAAEEAVNIKKLAKTYAAMSPEGAAAIMRELDDSTLVKIVASLKESESAPVLEIIGQRSDADAKRVAMITDRLRTFLSTPVKETKKGQTP